MKHKISLITDKAQQKNLIFDFSPDNPVNRDDGVYPYFLLKKKLAELDIDIATQDLIPPKEADLLIFIDFPNEFEKFPVEKNKFLVLTECELIKPENWVLQHHSYFKKIFTWNDNLIDHTKYFKLNFSNKLSLMPAEGQLRKLFCCLIAGKKSVNHIDELYSKRVEAIRWFEKNASIDFDLYGKGWDMHQFTGPFFLRALNRIRFLRRLFSEKFPSYRGMVKSKLQTLAKYQFSICYENAQNIPGYITEKIFDVMFAGCIPIYWGAPNVTDWIPSDCFIDFRNFKNYQQLYSYLKNLSENEIFQFQKNIFEYLNSEKVKPFTAEYFADTLTREISVTLTE